MKAVAPSQDDEPGFVTLNFHYSPISLHGHERHPRLLHETQQISTV